MYYRIGRRPESLPTAVPGVFVKSPNWIPSLPSLVLYVVTTLPPSIFPALYGPLSRSLGSLSWPASLLTYVSSPIPLPKALSQVLGAHAQPPPRLIGRWYHRKPSHALAIPRIAPEMMSNPWCLKSEYRVEDTYMAAPIGMRGKTTRYVGAAAACLRRERLSWLLWLRF